MQRINNELERQPNNENAKKRGREGRVTQTKANPNEIQG